MRSTTTGMNRTGAVSSASGTRAMMEASNELTPPLALDLAASKTQRARYIAESDAVGSIPPPATLKGMVKTGVARLSGSNLGVLLDKIGERIAFERAAWEAVAGLADEAAVS